MPDGRNSQCSWYAVKHYTASYLGNGVVRAGLGLGCRARGVAEKLFYVNKSVDDRLLSLVWCEWHLERKGVQGIVTCPAPP